ncbi:MAG: tripartite tricarboxylate transporter substrate-binding protein, partial [Betaproteobacteria bacterium]
MAPCGPRRPRPTCEPQSTPPGSRARTPSTSSSQRWPDNRPARPSPENHASKWGWVITATARSAPDGYTIGMVTVSSHGINPTLYGDLMRYDAVKDFAPIILAAETKN